MSSDHFEAKSISDGFRLAVEKMKERGYRISAGSFAEHSSVHVFSVETNGPATYNHSKHHIDVLIKPYVDVSFTSMQDWQGGAA